MLCCSELLEGISQKEIGTYLFIAVLRELAHEIDAQMLIIRQKLLLNYKIEGHASQPSHCRSFITVTFA